MLVLENLSFEVDNEDVFKKIHSEKEGSIIIISHQERILDVADEIIAMVNGEIVKQGSKELILPELLNEDESD